MSDDVLHDTHEWGERVHLGNTIPVCLVCRVDGYENEPAAFAPCPGPPETKQRSACPATLKSTDTPGHVHHCIGGHTRDDSGDHFCGECRRWFGTATLEDLL